MRNNPYYELEDKFIQLVSVGDDYRTYSVPYPGGGRFDSGKIFANELTIYDNGNIQFGSGKIRDPYSVAPGTLKSAFFRE